MRQFYTYLHCRPNGEPFYVGKGSKGAAHKKRSHDLKFDRNDYYRNVVTKYGEDNIGIFVFPCESEDHAFKDEIQQIAQLRNEGYALTNLTIGGDGASGNIQSEKAKSLISQKNRGRKLSLQHKLAISNGNKNRIVSKETREKISKALMGRKVTDSFRQKMRIIASRPRNRNKICQP